MPAQAPGRAWPLLAQIPEVPRQEPEKTSARVSNAAKEPVYRFDPPDLPQPHAPVERANAGGSAGSRDARATDQLPGASGLPLWANPSQDPDSQRPSSPSKGHSRGQTVAGTVARFLLLVALFTAAGVSLRLMGTPDHQPATTPTESPSPANSGSAAASMPSLPPVLPPPPAVAPVNLVTPTAAESLLPGAITPSTVAVDQLPAERYADESSVTLVYPKTLHPGPTSLETLETDEDSTRAPTQSSAVARLPGYILEIPPHQAQHDQDESNVH